jgi:pimeloyl-ACP methyl ester carboxylesterase
MKKFLAGLALVLVAAGATLYFSPPALLATVQFAEQQMAGLTARQVQVGEFNIHYYEGGPRDAPSVLLIHGFGADKDNWLRFSRALTDSYHVIALDLPGFGDSTKNPEAAYDLNSQVVRLEAFVRELGLDKVHVVGNSMGGQLAGMFAARYPQHVASAALFANAGITSPRKSELQTLIESGQPNPLIVTDAASFGRLMDFLFVRQPPVPEPMKQYFAERAIASSAFNERVFGQLMSPLLALETELGNIQVPALLLWGDNDRLLDVSSIEVMKPLLRQPSVVVMEDCGHLPMVERPEETASHYLSFLASLQD